MEIRFENYRFNQAQQLLYRDNELIALKSNQAALLELFLLNPEKIFSKDDIMNAVWQDRVVTEQVVFQNISQLRAIFGSTAIKTFSKKGYQWQIEIAPDKTEELAIEPAHVASPPIKKKPPVLQICFYLIVLLLLTYFYNGPHQSTATNVSNIYIVQNKNTSSQLKFEEIAHAALTKNASFKAYQSQYIDSATQLFMTPSLSWTKAALNPGDWLIWGDSYTSERGIFLHYGLSRNKIYWQGYIFAENLKELNSRLSARLNQLDQFELFSLPDAPISPENLLKMYEMASNDADILLKLANHYIRIEQLDVAITYLQRILKGHQNYQNRPYLAEAHWLIGKIYKMRSQHSQSLASLDKMSAILTDTNLSPLKLKSIKTHAWLAHDIGDFTEMFRILEQGLSFGQQQSDPLIQFELHILYSILAKKAGDNEQKYHHLNEAQALLLKHKLDESNLAVVYFHFALFTNDNNKAIPYLERIIMLPKTGQNYWVLDGAFEMLVEHYIEQKSFKKAHALFERLSQTPDTLVSQARVYIAENKPDLAHPLLEEAYESARLQYNTHAALLAAFNLYQLSHQADTKAEYLAFMQSNASQSWLERHTGILALE